MCSAHPESTYITYANNETEHIVKCELYETMAMVDKVPSRREYTVTLSFNGGEILHLEC